MHPACHTLVVLGVVGLFPVASRAEGFGPAHGADDGWLPSAAADDGAGAWSAGAGAVYMPGYVPPFRAGARDRLAYGVGGRWRPAARVEVSLGFDGLWDHDASGDASGPGDVRVGTVVTLFSPGALRIGLGWSAKFPDARDENQLGTDETDVTFGGSADWHSGPWRAVAGVGLGIWGNPLRFANQDDVPELRVAGSWTSRIADLGVTVNGDVETSRNPARWVAGGWVRHDFPVGASFAWIEAAGGAGLSPAAPDAIAALSFGFGQPPTAADPGARHTSHRPRR